MKTIIAVLLLIPMFAIASECYGPKYDNGYSGKQKQKLCLMNKELRDMQNNNNYGTQRIMDNRSATSRRTGNYTVTHIGNSKSGTYILQ